jgi:hypothetical protein
MHAGPIHVIVLRVLPIVVDSRHKVQFLVMAKSKRIE